MQEILPLSSGKIDSSEFPHTGMAAVSKKSLVRSHATDNESGKPDSYAKWQQFRKAKLLREMII